MFECSLIYGQLSENNGFNTTENCLQKENVCPFEKFVSILNRLMFVFVKFDKSFFF